jgi:hypothetical protein
VGTAPDTGKVQHMTANDDRGLETPDADRLEQLLPVGSDQPDDQDDAATARVAGSVVDIDADEADVLEQAIPVPAEEDYRDQ